MKRTNKLLLVWVLLAGILAGGLLYKAVDNQQSAYGLDVKEARRAREQLSDMKGHNGLSKLFRTVAKAVKPSVVEVRVVKRIKAAPMSPELNEFFRRFFGEQSPFEFEYDMPQRQRKVAGLGSGVIVDDKKGYVLTNYHVVGGADEVEVILADKRKYDAEWIRTDPQTDLAVIKIDAEGLVEAPLGDSDKIAVGDWVLAIGAPENLPQTVTAGIISAKGRTTGRGGYENFLQTDAAINRGNSGGPLVNMRGEIVGINTAIVSRTGVNEGIGLSIPSNMVKNVMNQLVEKGEVVRGYLGVIIQNVDERLAKSFELPSTKGALVAKVFEDTPAQKAGVKVGDFIVSVNGEKVDSVNELRNTVARIEPGEEVEMEIYRGGDKKTLEITIGTQPDKMARGGMGRPAPRQASEDYGLNVKTLSDELAERLGYEDVKGVLVVGVDSDSDAAESGVRPGMVITHVDGERVKTAEEFAEAISGDKAAAGVRMRVVDRQGNQRFVFITPKESEK